MKPITQLILILLLTFTFVPVYGEEDHKGMWACMITEGFGYEDGRHKTYGLEKFTMKVTEETISPLKGTGLGDETLKIINKEDIVLRNDVVTGTSSDGMVFKLNFKTEEFIWAHIFNHDTPAYIASIGNCQKFDAPE